MAILLKKQWAFFVCFVSFLWKEREACSCPTGAFKVSGYYVYVTSHVGEFRGPSIGRSLETVVRGTALAAIQSGNRERIPDISKELFCPQTDYFRSH